MVPIFICAGLNDLTGQATPVGRGRPGSRGGSGASGFHPRGFTRPTPAFFNLLRSVPARRVPNDPHPAESVLRAGGVTCGRETGGVTCAQGGREERGVRRRHLWFSAPAQQPARLRAVPMPAGRLPCGGVGVSVGKTLCVQGPAAAHHSPGGVTAHGPRRARRGNPSRELPTLCRDRPRAAPSPPPLTGLPGVLEPVSAPGEQSSGRKRRSRGASNSGGAGRGAESRGESAREQGGPSRPGPEGGGR